MSQTHTYTVATLEVSGTVWDEVWSRLREAGHLHRRMPANSLDGRDGIDMSAIALVRAPSPPALERAEHDLFNPAVLEEGEIERLWHALQRAETLIAAHRGVIYDNERTPDGAVESANARRELSEHDDVLRMIRESAELLK